MRARISPVLLIVAALAVGVAVLAIPGENDDAGRKPPEDVKWINSYVERFQEAQRLFGRGDDAEAERIFLRLSEEEPDAAAVHHALGILYRQTGRREASLDRFLRAAAIDLDAPVIARDAAAELLAAGRAAEAVVLFERARRRWPDELDTLLGQGAALRALGQGDEAERTYRHAVEVDPDSIDARTGLAATIVLRDPAAALEVIAPIPSQYADVALVRGLANARLGQFEAAGPDLLIAAQGAPNDPVGRNIVREASEALLRCGDYARAVTAATRWTGPGQTDPRAAFGLAMAHAGNGSPAEALTALDRVRDVAKMPAPIGRHITFTRALLLRAAGRTDDARAVLAGLADDPAESFERSAARLLLRRDAPGWPTADTAPEGRKNDVLLVESLVAADAGLEDEAERLRAAAREATSPPGEFPAPLLGGRPSDGVRTPSLEKGQPPR